MESGVPTPRFTVGLEIATFLVSCGLLRKVWDECLTSASNAESFTVNEYEDVVYVTFPSFQRMEDFFVNERWGNRQTDHSVFPGCLKGNDGKPALIHPGALALFLHVMENTDFKRKIYQLEINTDSKQRDQKPVIFVGHSLGGAVATLATLWILEKGLSKSSSFCITFGCPLVGDVNLVEAIGRENWAGNFCHVVSKNDIVPRMLLAPFDSTHGPLNALLPYWRSEIINARIDEPDSSIQDAYKTLHQSVSEPGTSSYKPFGTYIFCSSDGATCITNSQTVLEMLRLTMQNPEPIVQDFLLEHVSYGSILEDALQNFRRRTSIVNPNSESSYEMGISLQLRAIGVQSGAARIALRREGEIKHKLNTNVANLATELSNAQSMMAELEWYKEDCEKDGDIGYYDTFKKQLKKDIHADQRRLMLGTFWDGIIEMWESNELPCDFQSQNKWINAGNTYRRFVEPLDIAYYYRNNPNGNYISDGRPNRYKVLQKWMEEKEKTRSSRGRRPRTKQASLFEDSCFWAHVEEALKDLENLKQGSHQQQSLQNLEMFEQYVEKMKEFKSNSPDIFLWNSSYMKWRREWEEHKKSRSPE